MPTIHGRTPNYSQHEINTHVKHCLRPAPPEAWRAHLAPSQVLPAHVLEVACVRAGQRGHFNSGCAASHHTIARNGCAQAAAADEDGLRLARCHSESEGGAIRWATAQLRVQLLPSPRTCTVQRHKVSLAIAPQQRMLAGRTMHWTSFERVRITCASHIVMSGIATALDSLSSAATPVMKPLTCHSQSRSTSKRR